MDAARERLKACASIACCPIITRATRACWWLYQGLPPTIRYYGSCPLAARVIPGLASTKCVEAAALDSGKNRSAFQRFRGDE